ncbi:hypothetical protein HK097_001636 [Rhizophlyctis rosea]|uniref:Uncharacterized protein n=1 Tax=Rhizophlyctis rosea TaxID=64517 RepID=A0AAD5SIY7_9FUNG|nr:hypothetical protein HK097_001636 [Rhizophlyctis rosea]
MGLDPATAASVSNIHHKDQPRRKSWGIAINKPIAESLSKEESFHSQQTQNPALQQVGQNIQSHIRTGGGAIHEQQHNHVAGSQPLSTQGGLDTADTLNKVDIHGQERAQNVTATDGQTGQGAGSKLAQKGLWVGQNSTL